MNPRFTRIGNTAQDIANAARELFALDCVWNNGSSNRSELQNMREEEIATDFKALAEMLGYRVERIEPDLQAAE
ncbi:hypothetical protein ACLE20_13245 [Rhizobium sp. YIM 134829]|uniref:hypothetical protein n=1 Tax=Rhizobium sp. YIM 134829 TaxID=3390453 RepID=UPI003977FFB0